MARENCAGFYPGCLAARSYKILTRATQSLYSKYCRTPLVSNYFFKQVCNVYVSLCRVNWDMPSEPRHEAT